MFHKILSTAWTVEAEQCAYAILSRNYKDLTEIEAEGLARYLSGLAAADLTEAERDLARKDLLQSLFSKFQSLEGIDLDALTPFYEVAFQGYTVPCLADTAELYTQLKTLGSRQFLTSEWVLAAGDRLMALCHGDPVYEAMARRALLNQLLWRSGEPEAGPPLRVLAAALAETEKQTLQAAAELLAEWRRYP